MTSLLTVVFMALFNTVDIKSKFESIKSKVNGWIEKKRDDYRAWKRHRKVRLMYMNKLKPKKINPNKILFTKGKKIEDKEIEYREIEYINCEDIEDINCDYIEDRMN